MKFYIDEHGCAKNQVDAEYIMTALINKGDEEVDDPKDADTIIVNTCAFIEAAKKESLEAIFALRKEFPDKELVVCGCMAQRYYDDLEKLSEVDTVYKNRNIKNITRKTFLSLPGSVYVKITEGCSNHCSYCAIPLIRGELKSRSIQSVVDEVHELVTRKDIEPVREINLVGQDLASFGRDTGEGDLPTLLQALSKIEGDFIIRMLYIHPDHFPKNLLEVMKADARIVPYFDLPFQSGSEKILRAMGREGNSQKYIELVKNIKAAFPEAVIRTTFLVGFPGETEEDFAATKALQKAIEPLWCGTFPYSREEGTPAFAFKNRVSKVIARVRAQILDDAQEEITKRLLRSFIGKTYKVLIEDVESPEVYDEPGDFYEPFGTHSKEELREYLNEHYMGKEEEREKAINVLTTYYSNEVLGDDGERFAVGRAWWGAPEVDGDVVIRYEGRTPKPGEVIEAKIISSNGVDTSADAVIK